MNLFLLPNGPGSETDRATEFSSRAAQPPTSQGSIISGGRGSADCCVLGGDLCQHVQPQTTQSLSGEHGPYLVLF